MSKTTLSSNDSSVGGLPNSHHDKDSNLSGGSGRTFLSSIGMVRSGVVDHFVITQSTGIDIRVSIWRSGTRVWIGDQVTTPGGDSEIPCGFFALEGDQIAVWTPDSMQSTDYTSGEVTWADDVSSSVTDAANLTNTIATRTVDIEAVGVAPFLVTAGDSIMMGTPSFKGHFDATMGGDITRQTGYQVATALNWGFENNSDGSKAWDWGAATALPYVTGTHANVIAREVTHALFAFGINDITSGRTWANVETDLDTMRAAMTADQPTAKVFLTEILPKTNGTGAQNDTVRTFNANYAIWCAANDVTLIICHDAMADPTDNDALIPGFDADGVHLSADGVAAFANIIRSQIDIGGGILGGGNMSGGFA